MMSNFSKYRVVSLLGLALMQLSFILGMSKSAFAQQQAGDIYAYAGTLSNSGCVAFDSGNGGSATSACMSSVNYVAVDKAGDVFISEGVAGCVREVSAGVISTYAGTCGTQSYTQDGQTGPNTLFGVIGQIAVDQNGNLFITDITNDIVREVNVSTKLVSTVAGISGMPGNTGYNGSTPATSAELNGPAGVAIDTTTGDIYISDTDNCAIRHVTASTGIISTYAGGACGFNGDGSPATNFDLDAPHGLAAEISVQNGFTGLFIADTDNCRVRKVDSSGNMTTYAGGYLVNDVPCGTATSGNSATSVQLEQVSQVALDAAGNLFIADDEARIQEVMSSSGSIVSVAGTGSDGSSTYGVPATSSQIGYSTGVAIDCLGNLYLADASNYVVSEVSQIGIPCSTGIYLGSSAASFCVAIETGSYYNAHYSNELGPLASNGGDAQLVAETESAREGLVYCGWSGFPSVTAGTGLNLHVTLSSSTTGSGTTPVTVIDSGSCSEFSASYPQSEVLYSSSKGQYNNITVPIPAGTNLSNISLCAGAVGGTLNASTATLAVGYIYIQ